MDEYRVEHLRRKVEAGEPLSDLELRLLESAAQRQGGPTLRLAVAHALINSGQDRQAVALLETLRQDFPRDLQVHLGHARALVSLERLPEADASLKAALALNPGDPEALKVLALLALQRGEVRKARALIEDVLRVDPFDGEARLVKTELDSSDLDTRPSEPVAMRDEFIRALMEQLVQKKMTHARRGKDLLLALPNGGVARVFLATLYAAYLENRHPLEEAIRTAVAELQTLVGGAPKDKPSLLAAVLPVLREPTFREEAGGSLSREGPGGLMVYYVFDDPALLRYVPPAVLSSCETSLEELDSAAWTNLSSRLSAPKPIQVTEGLLSWSGEPTGLWAVSEGDGSDAARLLIPRQRDLLHEAVGEGPYFVQLGRRELALVCREVALSSVARLRSVPSAADGIAGGFSLGKDGLVPVK